MEKENLDSEFIPYTPALRMKALGFDEPCLAFYLLSYASLHIKVRKTRKNIVCLAPTWKQAFKWFRDELKYEVFLQKQENLASGKTYSFLIENDLEGIIDRTLYKSTTEKAELACLEKLLDIVEAKLKKDGK